MWDHERIESLLRRKEDLGYRDFHGGLTKTSYDRMGVRVPDLRAMAKEIIRSGEWRGFLAVRSIIYYEHAMLAGIVTASVREPYEDKIVRLREFSSCIDDWAVCDITCSSLSSRDPRLFGDMQEFSSSAEVWLARMGLVTILGNFADREHLDRIRETIDGIRAKGYYIDMAVGWLICTVESHDEGAGIELIETSDISDEVKKIAAAKMRDSYRVTEKSKKKAKELARG